MADSLERMAAIGELSSDRIYDFTSELADTKAPTLNTTNVIKEKVGRGSSMNLSSAYGVE